MRAGYRSDTDVEGFSGISIGSGLELGRAAFDFAWVPFGELGNAYRFSLHLKFGPASQDIESPDNGVQLKQASATPADRDPGVRDAALEQLLSL